MARFVLTAGHPFAQHVAILGQALLNLGHSVPAILMVSPWQAAQVRRVIRQRGLRWVARRLGTEGSAEEGELAQLRTEFGIHSQSLPTWSRRHSVRIIRAKSLNHDRVLRELKSIQPDAVIYGGGGILRTPFLRVARKVLNAHSGPLPEIRGMNAAEWAFLLGEEAQVTIHLIDEGIDTGPVLRTFSYCRQGLKSAEELRDTATATGLRGLIATIREGNWCEQGVLSLDRAGHRQCFSMAPALLDLIDYRLSHQ